MANHNLELEKILENLTEYCALSATKERVNALEISHDIVEVMDLLAEVTNAKKLLIRCGNPVFYDVCDPESALKRTELNGVLSCEELLEIAVLLKNARELSEYIEIDVEKATVLDKYFSVLQPQPRLEDNIFKAIVSKNEVADNASQNLLQIRRKIRVLNVKTREYLSKFITKENRALQENLITIRNNRFVIPVKSEFKGQIPGLIHDISASGATLFIEPTAVVEANNEIKILIEEEKIEVERILKLLSMDCKTFAGLIRLNHKILTELDMIFAKAKLSIVQNAMQPKLNTDGYTNLIEAVHPLLDQKTAIPVTISVGGEFDTLIITGPNTGGKTVCLKTIGIFTKMVGLGLHIPVSEGSEINIGGKVFAAIGDEQSIGESLSTFSAHMKNIIEILDKATRNDLILFDELGSGTDPAEGSALAVAIIEYARSKNARIVATTHYSDIKLYASNTERVENASFEFDVENLTPTYNLVIGNVGKSNAFEISKKLGLSDKIIENAKNFLTTEHNKFENLLAELESSKIETDKLKAEAIEIKNIAKNTLERAEAKERELSQKMDNELFKAKKEAASILDEAKRASRQALNEIDELKKQAKDDARFTNVNKTRADIHKNLSPSAMPAVQKAHTPVNVADLTVGTEVKLIKTGNIATVIEAPNREMKVLVKAGILKITAHVTELEIVKKSVQNIPQNPLKNKQSMTPKPFGARPVSQPTRQLRNNSAMREVDIRGMDTLEGISEVEAFISSALMSNLNEGFVIHGKGTGVLKNAVREHLRGHKNVKSYRPGVYGEGEDGVTVVTFK